METPLAAVLTSFTDFRVLAVHLCVAVMLVTGMILRRSLGAWPCWIAAFLFAVLVETIWRLQGLPRDVGLATLVEMMVLPSALLVLARRQVVPGLRRGEWTEAERRRWLKQQALASNLPSSSTGLVQFR